MINQKTYMISYKKKRCFLAKNIFDGRQKNQFLMDFLKNEIFILKSRKKDRLVTRFDPFFQTRH